MRLLLDTHTLIWITMAPERVSDRLRDIIEQDSTEVYVSAVTAWEIGTKMRVGKLSFDVSFLDDFDARVIAMACKPLPITAQHGRTGAGLSGAHRDPFDRLLAGQAIVEHLTIATVDPHLAALGAAVIW